MKIIFLFLIIFSGSMAQAQHTNSQASQVIALRLQPISFIDLSAAGKPAQADSKNSFPATSSREIIVNKTLSSGTNDLRNEMAYNTARPQQVYTFSRK